MASRDSTGLMVAVILLVLLTVLLSFGTYMGMTKAYENFDAKETAKADAVRQSDYVKAIEAELAIVRAYVGMPDADLSSVQTHENTIGGLLAKYQDNDQFLSNLNQVKDKDKKAYEDDMLRYGSTDPADVDKNWRKLVDHFAKAVNSKHQELASSKKRVETAEQEMKTEVARMQQQLDTALAAQQKAEEDLDTETKRHKAKEAEQQSQLAAVEAKNRELNEQKNSLRADLDRQVGVFKELIEVKDRDFAALKAKYDEMNRKTFTIPDGKIVNVNRNSRYAYINVGQADGLRTTQTFEVFDKNQTNFELENGKGKIEVIRFVEPHVSEVRITDSDPLNPILPNDHILSATWDPGSPVEVAIVGFIDIDGDKRSDRLRLETMVRLNGGKVVAKHDETGNVTGEMSPNTRYLVVGIPPTEMNFEPGSEVVKAWNQLNDEAKRFHVQEISLQKFLNSMGYHGGATVERLDGNFGSRVKSSRQAQEENSDR